MAACKINPIVAQRTGVERGSSDELTGIILTLWPFHAVSPMGPTGSKKHLGMIFYGMVKR